MPLWLKKTLLCSWKKLIYETVFADSVISENNDNTFKIRLDRFWANQELIFDYKGILTGTGNSSIVDSFDVNTV